MSALRHAIPRAFDDHRSGPGRRYAAVCRAYAMRCGGTVSIEAREPLKRYGRLTVDVDRVNEELERALTRRRIRDARRLRRQLAGMNRELLALEQRLEDLAKRRRPRSLADWPLSAPEER